MWWKCTILIILAITINVIFSKTMYTLVHERAELLDYNHSLVTNDVYFSFRKINRTNFAFNVSFNLLQDITDRKVMARVYVDKLFGTEYKRTGTVISMNVCKLIQRNLFGFADAIKKAGNLEVCNVVKGHYYLTNFMPKDELFPKYLPFGSYRIDINIFHENDVMLFRMYWFARVERLPK